MNYRKEFEHQYSYANLEDFVKLQKHLYTYLQDTGHYLKGVELRAMDDVERERVFKFSLQVWESKKEVFD